MQAHGEAVSKKRNYIIGVSLAGAAALLWSGNYIVARGVHQTISPVSLAFFRWLTATMVLAPFAIKKTRAHWPLLRQKSGYLIITALLGVTLFNTFIYVAGHYSTAINLAIIGTTAAPVFVLLLSRFFLKERLSVYQVAGALLCITGIVLLISKGAWQNLLQFRLTAGDLWILAAALSFAFYTLLVRKKPVTLPAIPFLFSLFALGTLLLLPAYLIDAAYFSTFAWSSNLVLIFLYLGIGASFGAFLCWNLAIQKIGAAKTALFANLIPVFSSIEAIFILGEENNWVLFASLGIILSGLLLANYKLFKKPMPRW